MGGSLHTDDGKPKINNGVMPMWGTPWEGFKMKNFDLRMKEFADLKYKGFRLGKNRSELSELQKLIAVTDYPSGDVAEIVMAYMLGLFCSFRTDLYVAMTASMDKNGVDFMLTRFSEYNYPVQVKFNRKNERVYAPGITVVELGPDRLFSGKKYLDPEAGNLVLLHMLTECGAYEEEELFDFFDESEGIEELFIAAWRLIKN